MDLHLLNDDDFTELVNRDVRGNLEPDTSALLREPPNINRWHDTLLRLKRNVEAQLTSSRSDLLSKQATYIQRGTSGKLQWIEAKAQAEKWRQGAIRFKNGVEERLLEAKGLRRTMRSTDFQATLVSERDKAVAEMTRLRSAILDHKQGVLDESLDEDFVDDRLWASL